MCQLSCCDIGIHTRHTVYTKMQNACWSISHMLYGYILYTFRHTLNMYSACANWSLWPVFLHVMRSKLFYSIFTTWLCVTLHADIFKVQPQNMLVVLWFCACTRTLGRRHLHAVCCTVLASESFIMPCTHTQTHTIRHFTLFYLCINSCEQPKPHLIVSQHQISGVSTCCFFQFVFHLSIRKLKPNFLSERTVIVREIQLSSSLNN